LIFLVDTNVLSELRKSPAAVNPCVKAWAQAQDIETLFISVISVLEVRRGVHLLEKRGDQAQAAVFAKWLNDRLLPAYTDRILPASLAIALTAATLPWESPSGRDALIASTAKEHKATVVTRNVKHFEAAGVRFVNPWEFMSAQGSVNPYRTRGWAGEAWQRGYDGSPMLAYKGSAYSEVYAEGKAARAAIAKTEGVSGA
jgi:predicted nucleic acid-binding protein